MTDLLYSEVEEDLRSAVRSVLTDKAPAASMIAEKDPDPALWRTLAVDLGVAGLAIPEEYGGAGASWREVAVVLEELGRSVAPVPYLGSSVVATATLLAAGDRELLSALASGESTAALVMPFAVGPHGEVCVVHKLCGTVAGVADALHADVLLVPSVDGLYAVSAADVAVTPVVSLDMSRPLCDITLDSPPARRVGPLNAVNAGLCAGAALLPSEQLGVASWCLDTTVEYVRTRYQFGRQVGSFQALKHRLAEVWVAVTQARAVARYAADCLTSGDPDSPVATALAQAHCSDAAVHAAEECVQLHGGIGFTWEHPAHLYLKRAKSSAIAFGTADRYRAALAHLVDLPSS